MLLVSLMCSLPEVHYRCLTECNSRSSIVNGGTSAIFILMALLAL